MQRHASWALPTRALATANSRRPKPVPADDDGLHVGLALPEVDDPEIANFKASRRGRLSDDLDASDDVLRTSYHGRVDFPAV